MSEHASGRAREDFLRERTAVLQRRVRVARGEERGDLVLTGGRVVNVFTRSVERANVVIADGWIAGVGPYDWDASEAIDVDGAVVSPGLVDGHIHIESTLLMPAELARLVVPRGTAAIVADPHEIANVLGADGIDLMIRASADLPLACFFMIPSCVPASPFETAGAVLDAADVAALLGRERVMGLAEMMNFPGVLASDESVLAKIAAARAAGGIVDGHCPGLLGRDLAAYAAAGIRSDHECTTVEEARQRAALGMMVQVREGSMARNLDELLPSMRDGSLGEWCLCTDDVHPEDLVRDGHLDRLVRRVVAAGVPAAEAIRHAALVPARHYGLEGFGAAAPGYRAALAVFEDLTGFETRLVVADGRVVARDGQALFAGGDAEATERPSFANTIHLGPLSGDTFALRVSGEAEPVIGIVPDQIVTTHERRRVRAVDGWWSFDPADDVALIACVQRHAPSGRAGVALVSGFGFAGHGALGSSVGHDAHNLLIAGTNASDMLACAHALAESGGGFTVVREGEILGQMALPVAGLMSTAPAREVCRQQEAVNAAAARLGCRLHSPFGTLSFLGLSVIPALRITDRGLFDVERFELV